MNSRAFWILIRLCRGCGRSGCWTNNANLTYTLHQAPSSKRGLVCPIFNIFIVSDKAKVSFTSLSMPNRPSMQGRSMVNTWDFLVSHFKVCCLQPTFLISFNNMAKVYPIHSLFKDKYEENPSLIYCWEKDAVEQKYFILPLYTKFNRLNLQRVTQWHFTSKQVLL